MREDGSRIRNIVDEVRHLRARRRRRLRARMRLRGRVRRTLPPVSVIPTLCTLGNLVAGFAAIYFAAIDPQALENMGKHLIWNWSPLTLAGAMVFLGMFLDAIDGS